MLCSLNQHPLIHIHISMCHLLRFFFPLEVGPFVKRNNLRTCRTFIVIISFPLLLLLVLLLIQWPIIFPILLYLSAPIHAFINSITKSKDPQKYSEAILDQLWCDAMKEEIGSQERTKTWSVCSLPPDKKLIRCK